MQYWINIDEGKSFTKTRATGPSQIMSWTLAEWLLGRPLLYDDRGARRMKGLTHACLYPVSDYLGDI